VQNVPSLLVVANVVTAIPGPVPGRYAKMVTVVDAATGDMLLSYPVDPTLGI
jgi:hypothetical protein